MGLIRRGYAKLVGPVRKLIKLFFMTALTMFTLSLAWVIALRWIPVYYTPLVVIRAIEYGVDGKWVHIEKTWKPLNEISVHLQKAVIASEDPTFLKHWGFDFKAISKAINANKKRKTPLGASTISQQTAKNVFLYPSRTYLRKAFEVYFTLMIEALWGKKRILEVYLNVIELGSGIYGAEAAAQHFYYKPAKKLTADEASMFAAILPNPRRWNPRKPTNFVLRRRNFVRRNLVILGNKYFNPLMASKN